MIDEGSRIYIYKASEAGEEVLFHDDDVIADGERRIDIEGEGFYENVHCLTFSVGTHMEGPTLTINHAMELVWAHLGCWYGDSRIWRTGR